jgi:hypothetical protein
LAAISSLRIYLPRDRAFRQQVTCPLLRGLHLMMITYNVYIQNNLYNSICIKYDYQVINSHRNPDKTVALFIQLYLNFCCKNHLDFNILHIYSTKYSLIYRSKLILYMILSYKKIDIPYPISKFGMIKGLHQQGDYLLVQHITVESKAYIAIMLTMPIATSYSSTTSRSTSFR